MVTLLKRAFFLEVFVAPLAFHPSEAVNFLSHGGQTGFAVKQASQEDAPDCSQLPEAARNKKIYDDFLSGDKPVVLFGWLGCPCVQVAETRFSNAGLCYAEHTWAKPTESLMAYLQCKVGDTSFYSFIFFRQDDMTMKFIGNGFAFADEAMTGSNFSGLIGKATAKFGCKSQATDEVNIYGFPLQECRFGTDTEGSWMDSGTCTEATGGVHQICLETIPADFSEKTKQSPWSRGRAGKRHCVCIGAWSLYMTQEETNPVTPHCKAIPATALSSTYVANWKDWNGYPADVRVGVDKLIEKCLANEANTEEKCGLKRNFEELQKVEQALSDLAPAGLAELSC